MTETGWLSSRITPVNSVGTSPSQVIGNNSQRVAIKFHNPGTVNVYCYSSQVTPAPSLSALGGTYVVYPGADYTIEGGNVITISAVNGPWFALSASGSANPLTITEMTQ
jgi:hypothetical protein